MAQRILLVDDNESPRDMFAKLLAQHGCKVAEASNGRAAMEQMQHKPAELLITDMIMPEMDGVENGCGHSPNLFGSKDHRHGGKRIGAGGEFPENRAGTGWAQNAGQTCGF